MQTKLCPQCGAEYFFHIEVCADCSVPLQDFHEIEKEEKEKARFFEEAGGEIVPVREGSVSWLKEMRRVLLDNGIKSYISLSPGCKPGNCQSTSLLFIAKKDLVNSEKHLQEYYLATHPESAVPDNENEDSCPACGHDAPQGVKECPDCGLTLIFDEY